MPSILPFYASEYNIVGNGLVLNLDARYQASYPGSGNTWTDLTGNAFNATSLNSPTFTNPYFTLNGSTQYFTVSGTPLTSATTCTIVMWIYSAASQQAWTGLFYNRGSNVFGFNFYGSTNKLGWTWNGAATTYNYDTGLTVSQNAWSMVALAVGSTSTTFYLNLATNTQTYTTVGQTFNSVMIGRDPEPSAPRYFNGRISKVLLYNRQLSSTEMTQNYNALSGRYSLPVVTTSGGGSITSTGYYALGGTITDSGGWRYHTFTSSDTFQFITNTNSRNVEVLIVAGGGAGGSSPGGYWESGGGGGGGGVLSSNTFVAVNNYSIIVGGGGTGQASGAGTSGANSSAFGLVAIGGGGGATPSGGTAGSGGSGGGGARLVAPGTGTSGQGNRGGTGGYAGVGTGPGGGGGGAGAPGANAVSGTTAGAAGGIGSQWPASSGIYYAGGGGGGCGTTANVTSNPAGGGGTGQSTANAATSGQVNTGGGGGGILNATGTAGAAGGSGIVIIRYPL